MKQKYYWKVVRRVFGKDNHFISFTVNDSFWKLYYTLNVKTISHHKSKIFVFETRKHARDFCKCESSFRPIILKAIASEYPLPRPIILKVIASEDTLPLDQRAFVISDIDHRFSDFWNRVKTFTLEGTPCLLSTDWYCAKTPEGTCGASWVIPVEISH